MRFFVTAVIAAIEAAAVAVVGLLGIAIPALLLWIITFDLAAEPAGVAAWTAGIWLLAHLVPLGFEVPAESALALGLAPEAISVPISLAPLGFTLVTVVLAVRAGWRFGGRGGVGVAGALGGGIGFAVVAFLAAQLAGGLVAWPGWLAVLVPAAVYAVASLAGFLVRAVREGHEWWQGLVRRVLTALDGAGIPGAAALRSRTLAVVRLAALSCATLLGLSAIAVAAALVVGYARVIELSQSLQLDWLGSAVIFIAQLAFIPVAVAWAGSWLTGAGFALGSGTSVTPFETLTGPLPALPMLGAIPQGWGTLGALPPALLVLAAVALGALFARRSELRRAGWAVALAVPVLAAAVAGLAVAGAAALASGAIGPDRLAVTGADPWLSGGLAAAELAIGLVIGVSAGRVDAARLREAVPQEVPGGETVRRFKERIGDRAADLAAGRKPRGAAVAPGASGARGDELDEQETAPIGDQVLAAAAQHPARSDEQETEELSLDHAALRSGIAEVVPFPGAAQLPERADSGREFDAGSAGADVELDNDLDGTDGVEDDVTADFSTAEEQYLPVRESFYDQDPVPDEAQETADVAVADGPATAEPIDDLDEEELLRAYSWDGGASFAGLADGGASQVRGADGAAGGADGGDTAQPGEAVDDPASYEATGRTGKSGRGRLGWRGRRRER